MSAEKPPRISGPAHLFAATRYSLQGAARLWRETAFRHHILFGMAALALLLWAGAGPLVLAGYVILWLVMVAVEALNTALEVLVDHISPGWAQFAKEAKDLGSFAVACLILANLVYVMAALAL
jgi:diacylglycerol kinase (ATP)